MTLYVFIFCVFFRWESSGVSMFILISSNAMCTFLPSGILNFMYIYFFFFTAHISVANNEFHVYVQHVDNLTDTPTGPIDFYGLFSSMITDVLFISGYMMTFVLGTLILIGGLGVAHRRTKCLTKVFPPTVFKQEDLYSLDGPLSHAEMIIYYKAM